MGDMKMDINYLIEEDINKILDSDLQLSFLKDATILVTGATGIIGSLIIKTILSFLGL